MGEFNTSEEIAASDTSSIPMIDWGLYGMMVRRERTRAGFKRAADFCHSVQRRTRVFISRDVLYKIEQGRQEPSGTQLAALNLSLFGEAFPSWLMPRLASNEWIEIEQAYREGNGDPINRPYVPEEWARENRAAVELFVREFLTPEHGYEQPGEFESAVDNEIASTDRESLFSLDWEWERIKHEAAKVDPLRFAGDEPPF